MNTRIIARITGVLYLATVGVFLVSNLLIKDRLIFPGDIAGTINLIGQHAQQYRLAVSLDFLAMVAVMALAVSLYAIFKSTYPYLALIAFSWRIGEVIIQAGAKIPEYLMLTLSQFALNSGGVSPALASQSELMLTWSNQALWLSFVFLSLGSVINNYLFFKTGLIPRFLAIFGLFATGLYTLGAIAALVIDFQETINMALMLPLPVFEISLGVFLTFWGMKSERPGQEALERGEQSHE